MGGVPYAPTEPSAARMRTRRAMGAPGAAHAVMRGGVKSLGCWGGWWVAGRAGTALATVTTSCSLSTWLSSSYLAVVGSACHAWPVCRDGSILQVPLVSPRHLSDECTRLVLASTSCQSTSALLLWNNATRFNRVAGCALQSEPSEQLVVSAAVVPLLLLLECGRLARANKPGDVSTTTTKPSCLLSALERSVRGSRSAGWALERWWGLHTQLGSRRSKVGRWGGVRWHKQVTGKWRLVFVPLHSTRD
jgi:hypothetical protein